MKVRLIAGENVGMALDAVWSHKVRSALTVLGIVIGITTVVTVGTITNGLREGIITFFLEFGPDNIFLNRVAGDPSARGSLKEQKRKPIRPEYAELITQNVRSVVDASVQLYVTSDTSGAMTAKVPGFETDAFFLSGFSGNAFEIQPREMQQGRVFTEEEANRALRVCAIGTKIAEALFPDGRAVGRIISVSGTEYEVLGVFAAAKGGFFGQNGQDQQIVIPLQTAMQRFPTEDRFIVVAKAAPGKREEAFEEIRQYLRRLRGTPREAEDDFALTTADQIAQRLDSILGVAVLISIALSSLGLLVGGIGVMNIMLVSVTERTKEIGVRKAIGAKRSDIVVQFLTEAVTLSGFGGALGIVVALAITFLIGKLAPAVASSIPAWTIISGVAMSVSVGLFFGTWPALKAAQLDPVEALRHE